ncbi:hypothetical protein PIB30_070131 [Stylosanthes scabra]|uniref:Uncharacterized protein n=1 Tax=Stylosanthes scabra TaxID=79078 RepID=A0ABU6UQL8_9FABA|nr:hypothetical protein [Stylosanthes scabra]
MALACPRGELNHIWSKQHKCHEEGKLPLMRPLPPGADPPRTRTEQPPPQDDPAEQLPQPETSTAPSASAQPAMDRSYQQIMRHLERQECLLCRQGRQIANTQLMIRQAFPDAVFEGLVSDDSGGSTEAES